MFTFSLGDLDQQEVKEYPFRNWEEAYRGKWKWDKVFWGSHQVDCWPGNGVCPWRVYVKDGKILWQEQASTMPTIEQGVPDFNPMGCQKGCGWSELLHAKERVTYPLKRVGERGSGRWQRVTWDQALTEIADAILDALQEAGPESIFCPSGANGGGWGAAARGKFMSLIGGLVADGNADFNDFHPGMFITFGKFNPAHSEDDKAHSELILVWHMNPVYTRIPYYHFTLEARYKGAEVVLIAPDVSPSHMHTDYYIPVKIGTDIALAMSMCKVIIDEGLTDTAFVKDQTDLPLLVRLDNRKFLRQPDLEGQGRDDQFYFYDTKTKKVVEAPRGTLALGDVDPALEGTFTATLKNGRTVEVTPVFQLLKERLRDYEPEQVSSHCSVHPDVIRMLARKVAAKKTTIYEGYDTGKHYHGDLMGRSMYLLLALTGNWGKKGTGPIYWSPGPWIGTTVTQIKGRPGIEETRRLLTAYRGAIQAIKDEDPALTDEQALIEYSSRMAYRGEAGPARLGVSVPPVFYWYHHVGFREIWNKREWNDPSMAREFDEYMQEAMEKGWWGGVALPPANVPQRVMFEIGGNVLRRSRGGQSMFLKNLWPSLKMIVVVDPRMSTTGLFADFVLPTNQQYEKMGFGGANPHILNVVFHDKAVEPPGESMNEWQIFTLLSRKMDERAKARGFQEYKDARNRTHRLGNMEATFTANGAFVDEEVMMKEMVADNALIGVIPEDMTLEKFREQGFIRATSWGDVSVSALNQAADLKADETHNPFRNHWEKKQPFPTLVRRAQFYIDHEWFLEAGEELPVQKDVPKMGGDYPLMLTSGHNRWSIHSLNIVNKLMQNTHRGKPHLVMNTDDAARLGIRDDEEVRMSNDMGSCIIPVKLSPSVQPGQVICYNGWDPYQFRGWHSPTDVEGAMVKWLHLAGGYGHLRYWPIQWQPVPTERGTRVEVSKID